VVKISTEKARAIFPWTFDRLSVPLDSVKPIERPLLAAKRPFIRKRDLVVDNEWVENYPVSNRQGDHKTLSVCSGAGRALAKGHSRNIGYGMKTLRLN
jgi:hypothetical protein